MTAERTVARLAAAAAIAMAAATVYVLACGPFVTIMRPVESIRPGDVEAFNRGDLGVVRERFARRYLVQAYRRFSGKPAIDVVPRPDERNDIREQVKAWRAFRQQVAGTDLPLQIGTERDIDTYQSIQNCLRDTFAAALATGRARADQYGATSPAAREWVRAQDAVLSNCSGGMTLPDPAPDGADALTRADRAYQTAAAYFYAGRYDEAVKRFHGIAADASSPWRPYGRYLAGRARLRQATIPDPPDAGKFRDAEAEFRATLADNGAAFLHPSARGLLDLIAFRVDPSQLLRQLTATIGAADAVTTGQVNSYERLMNALLDDTVSFDYARVEQRDAIVRSGELSDWVLAMQGGGDEAAARAVTEWKRTANTAWLVASLWKIPSDHADAPALLDAAAHVPSSSPAFMTVAFLRVRLLAARGHAADARALLATLPRQARDRADAEAVNLLNAERFMLAQSMSELLEAAPRLVVSDRLDVAAWNEPDAYQGSPLDRAPVFDDDAGVVFTQRLPLARMVEAATSTALPSRLRMRVAAATFVRAWLLDRVDQALAVAPVLRTLSPSLAADMRRFENAPAADRHVAGLRLILRTPGMRAIVTGVEDEEDYNQKDVSRSFDHMFRRNWWCTSSKQDLEQAFRDDSELVTLLYGDREHVPAPAFLAAAEQAAVTREREAMAALGPAPNYLAVEAVKWAKSRPQDLDAAEALAHAVEGTRWGCTDEHTSTASRTAFQTLHQLFPKSEWAQKTKYWY